MFPLPKSYRYLTILIVFTLVSLTVSLSTVLADSKTFTGTIDVSNASMPAYGQCGTAEETRYQLHGAFTVNGNAYFEVIIDDFNIVSDDVGYRALSAYIATDVSMNPNDILAYWEEEQNKDIRSSLSTLVVGETYYVFTVDCSSIEQNLYDAVNYTIRVNGATDMDFVPAIDPIGDQSVIEGASKTIDINVVDNGTVTLGYQVFDKDDNMILDTEPLYSVVDNGNGTGAITFTPQVGDSAGAPYEVTVTAMDDDSNIMTHTFTVDVVVTESQSYSGTLDENSAVLVDSGNLYYQSHGAFTPTADGIYTLSLDSFNIEQPSDDIYNFRFYITPEPNIAWDNVIFGTAEAYHSGTGSAHANLKAGETYYLFATDNGSNNSVSYESMQYDVTMTGPLDKMPAPVIEPIRWQYVTEGNSLTIAPEIGDTENVGFDVYDKNGDYVSTEPFFEEDFDANTITFTPQSGDADNSPYTVVVYAYNPFESDFVSTVSTFPLIVYETIPIIAPIDDQIKDVIARKLIEVQVLNNSDVTLSYEVQDRDGNIIPNTTPWFIETDNGDGTGLIDIRAHRNEGAGSPYTITVTATDNDNNIGTETFTLTVAHRTGSGTMTAASSSSDYPGGNIRWRSHGTFIAPADGLYTVTLNSFEYTGIQENPCFTVAIIPMGGQYFTYLGFVEDTGIERRTVHANLTGDERYNVYALDCGSLENGAYESAEYEFMVTGPTDNSAAPIVDPIPDQGIVEGNSLTINANVSDDDLVLVQTLLLDDQDKPLAPEDNFLTEDGAGTITFAPPADASQQSPYTVTVFAYDSTNIATAQTFTLTVATTESETFSGTLDRSAPFTNESFCSNSRVRYQSHGSFVPLIDGLYTLSIDSLSYSGSTGDATFMTHITEDPTNYNLVLGYVVDNQGTQTSYHANLKAGQTYYLSVSDCSDLLRYDYDSAEYEFTLTGPTSNSSAPIIDPIGDQSMGEDENLTINVDTEDDGLTNFIAYVFNKDGQTIDIAEPFYAQVDNGDGTGTVIFTPEFGDAVNSPYEVVIWAFDAANIAAVETFTLEVVRTPAPPVFGSIDDGLLSATGRQSILVTATDANGDDIDISVLSAPDFVSLDISGAGVGRLTLLPEHGQQGDYIITMQASDIDGNTTVDIPVTVTPNEKPVFNPIADQMVEGGNQLEIRVDATDPESQGVSYRLLGVANQLDFVTLVGDTLTINPTANDGGTYRIIVEASDGFETRWEVFDLTVDTDENEKPNFDPIANVTLLPNEQETVTVNAIDPEGQAVTYRVVSRLPNFITWNTDTFTIVPSFGDEGSYRITVEASDGIERRWARFTVTVGAAENQKPVFEQVGDYWIAVGNTEFLNIIATDPEGEDLSYRVIGGANNLPDFMRWNPSVPRFRIAPRTGDNGTYTIRVEASDGEERRWMTFRVRVVNPPN